MTLRHLNITIIGAGVGGLAVALVLQRKGAQVTVLEQSEAISEVGAGLQVTPNGVAVLTALGLDAASVAMRSNGVMLLDGYTGRTVLHMDLQRYRPDNAFLLMHRADLIDLLAQGAREINGGRSRGNGGEISLRFWKSGGGGAISGE